MELTRRQLLKFSAALAAASAIGLELPVPKEADAAAGADKWIKGVCRYCGAGCGVYVGVSKGKVVAVKGDKDNWNKGYVCLKGFSCRRFSMHRPGQVPAASQRREIRAHLMEGSHGSDGFEIR